MRGTRGGTNNSNDSQVTFRMHAGVTTTGVSSSSKREREKLQNFLCFFLEPSSFHRCFRQLYRPKVW